MGFTHSPHRKGIFNRLARVSLLSILTLTLGTQALQAQERPRGEETAATTGFNAIATAPAADDLKSLVNDASSELRTLKSEFAKTPLGADLLRYAKNNGIRFALDASIAPTSVAEYNPADATIRIRPGTPLESAVIRTAHELRHGWQDKALGAFAKENGVLTPWQRWTLRRYMEADAEAFASYFEANRLQQGVQIQAGFADVMPASMIAMRLRGEYWTRDGLTFGKYRHLAFEPALAALQGYNAQHLSFVEKMTRQRVSTGGGKEKLEAQKAPDDASFAEFLRGFGGISFDKGAHTSLQSTVITPDMLTRGYPRLEGDPRAHASFLPELDRKMAELAALHNAWLKSLGIAPKPAAMPSS